MIAPARSFGRRSECLDEVVNLLSVRDGGECRILSATEYAGVLPHTGATRTVPVSRPTRTRLV